MVPDLIRLIPLFARYDFDLRTGKSETGLRACTYAVEVRKDEDGVDKVYMEVPEEGSGWRIVERRPVSEGAPVCQVGPPRLGSKISTNLGHRICRSPTLGF